MTRFVALFRAPGEPPHVEVSHADRTFKVTLRPLTTARRKTLLVRGATGEVVMSVPTRTKIEDARAFALQNAAWIAAQLSHVPERLLFEAGQTIPLRGVPHLIVRWDVGRSPVVATVDALGKPIIKVSGPEHTVQRQVKAFLDREAASDLSAAARRYAVEAGVEIRRIRLKDTTSRWGSCSSRGNLNFSWRLILAPPFVLDYLAAHEVSHLHEMNHSDRYWRIVRGICPDTDRAELWLKQNGIGLHRYG